MIGRTVRSRPEPVVWALLLIGLGFVLAIAGPLAGWPVLLPAALLPLAVGGSLLVLGRERPFVARFTEAGVEAGDPPVLVPYDRMLRVAAEQGAVDPKTFRKRSAALLVEHDAGVLGFPSRLDCPSHEIYAFLADRVPHRSGRDVHPALLDYLEREEARFGPDQIWVYSWTRRPRHSRQARRLRAICIGAFIAAVGWLALGFSSEAPIGWTITGVITAVTAAVLFLASRVANVPLSMAGRNLKQACLVIGPSGMAMVQGEVQGEIGWPEVLDIRYGPLFSFLGSGRGHASGLPFIRLRVKGAEIPILDIYDRPLYVIHDRMLECRSGQNHPAASFPEPR